ncbi:MAG: PRC-barrel domain-containing protein [Deltaproteobacteria bacterium]|nr:PRC-barrel domain-containing protein [Deltaproteobacteria bacterium]
MRRHLVIVLLAIVGLFLGTNGFTQEKKVPGAGDIAGKTAEGQRINAFMVEKIIGSKVINVKGETLGNIANLVVDIDTGTILYAILDFGGFLGIGDKLFPVPWESLAALPSEGIFFLNQSKEQMEKAPAFDKDKLPNMADAQWGEGIFKHYGAPEYRYRGRMGYGYGYGYGGYGYGGYYGSPMHPGTGRGEPSKKIFDSKTIKTISGQVIKVDQVPEPGSGMEMRLTVFIDKKEVLPVYLGPAFYIVGSEEVEHFKIGDQVTVSGSEVTVNGEPLMIAMTVKRGNQVLRLRDKDGNPEWIGWKKASE